MPKDLSKFGNDSNLDYDSIKNQKKSPRLKKILSVADMDIFGMIILHKR